MAGGVQECETGAGGEIRRIEDLVWKWLRFRFRFDWEREGKGEWEGGEGRRGERGG